MKCARLFGPFRLRHDLDRATVAFECVRSSHHVNRVHEELGSDPRLAFVLCETE